MLSAVFLGVLAVGLVIAAISGAGTAVAQVGEAAPDFTVELLQGGEFSLSRHLADDGRPLVINLWASWCAPCREEIPILSAFAEASPGTAVLGVAVEDRVEDTVEFASEVGPSYPLAHGNPDFEAAFPNFGLPVTYFLDGEGMVTAVHNGLLTEEALIENSG